MLTSLRIQNFRSIRDASVKLGQVNLFIGPNNSGKSNFLKGIEFASNRIAAYPVEQELSVEWYEQNLPRAAKPDYFTPLIWIQLLEQVSDEEFCEVNYSVQGQYHISKKEVITELKAAFVNTFLNSSKALDLSTAKPDFKAFPSVFYRLWERLRNAVVYKIEPALFKVSDPLSNQPFLDARGANIANFLNTLSQNDDARFGQLKKDFAECVGNLVSVSTPPDPVFSGNLKIKFFDSERNSYWAEEVSEGVLYFLALLCIVHQPNPPKLLLLEEPEKGIHPRRIKEVMDFIFELARLRDIQIILTSHSPYVVDHFADIPECISVFDREQGETVIHNAGDLINETNERLVAEGKKPIRYIDSLGEHWVSGFLGGVPA
ncbi:AAA family ATPase [Hymenobacter sp. BT664]|uniref:AAA family ATPase n=1 Tax=Hymenobacter montanus TaxID=2771359 RepID=A0A927GL62_9BACT|nr:AAA family ATPase [Hymenobacter montanus]MBD2770277.1 AAA family ATPase [Hymenobacter montanus]